MAFTARSKLLNHTIEMEGHSSWGDTQYLGDVTDLLALRRPLAHFQLPYTQRLPRRDIGQADPSSRLKDVHRQPAQEWRGRQPLVFRAGCSGNK